MGALEQLHPDRLPGQVDRLAHHAFRAQAWKKALKYLRQAGLRASSRSAYQQTATCFEQALVALDHLPESRDSLEQAVDLRLELRNVLILFGDFERHLNYLREAESMAPGATCSAGRCSVARMVATVRRRIRWTRSTVA